MLIAPQKTDFQEQKREIDRSSASGRFLPVAAGQVAMITTGRVQRDIGNRGPGLGALLNDLGLEGFRVGTALWLHERHRWQSV